MSTSSKNVVKGLNRKAGSRKKTKQDVKTSKITNSGYKTLKITDNWGRLEYRLGSIQINPVTPKGTVSLKIKGIEYDVKIRCVDDSTTVSDHGHNNYVGFKRMEVQIEVFDQNVWIDVRNIRGFMLEQSEWSKLD